MSAPVTSRILPMSEQDIADNTVRVEVTMPRDPDRTEQVREAVLTASSGWCAPSQAIYDIAAPIDYNEVAELQGYRFPRGGITFTVPNISPEAYRAITGWTPPEETLL